MTTRPSQRPRRLQFVQVWLLAALLLAAQALGLAHRVAHAPGLPAAVAVQAVAHAPAAADRLADVLADVLADAPAHGDAGSGHEAGSGDCRLTDQLAHADALCGGAGMPPALSRAPAIGSVADVPALPPGSAAAYLARGPPASA